MPRPRKKRNVCIMPYCTCFSPAVEHQGMAIKMTVDEFEAIRLIDLEGLTQEQCALQMNVARTTVQAIYQNARRKLAKCIVHGKQLKICGGDVHIRGHREGCCAKRCSYVDRETKRLR